MVSAAARSRLVWVAEDLSVLDCVLGPMEGRVFDDVKGFMQNESFCLLALRVIFNVPVFTK